MLLGLTLVISAAVDEIRTSTFQSWLFSRYANRASYRLAPGPSSSIAFPAPEAPYDRRVGYALLPAFQDRLAERGYATVEQARFSPALLRLAHWRVGLPYPERYPAGLLLLGEGRDTLYDAIPDELALRSYHEIPAAVVQALLYIENRELESGSSRRNPVIEWERLFKGLFMYAGSRIGLPVSLEGGSTLAVQLEKYRHSPSGRTRSAVDKLRQMLAASVKVYREGPDTREQRRRIVLDYLNSMPLSAAPGYGEVHGLGEGLWAWYGLRLGDVLDQLSPGRPLEDRARAFKHVLSLLCAVRAPTTYLNRNPEALERRVRYYARRLAEAGVIEPDLVSRLELTDLAAGSGENPAPSHRRLPGKAINAFRSQLQQMLGVPGLYELDRLDLEVETGLDQRLQSAAEVLLENLGDSAFLARHGLLGTRLLESGDPRGVVYSVLLYERTPRGNVLRVQTDNLNQALDLNDGMMLELGSTAKLRVLAHYLELVAGLHEEWNRFFDPLGMSPGFSRGDPITAWAREVLASRPGISLAELVDLALARRYPASPWEVFFTGGGAHTFRNFDPEEDPAILTVRQALVTSNNLVFIRLMRDLVRYHEARLPYEMDEVLARPDHPDRLRLLREISERESLDLLSRAHSSYQGLSPDSALGVFLGSRARPARDLAILFLVSRGPGSGRAAELERWLMARGATTSRAEVDRLVERYGRPELTLPDYGYLLRRNPLEIWAAAQAVTEPWNSWEELQVRSRPVRREASAWLLRAGERVRRAQDLRLRIRFEQEAFERMTPYWKRLGFPFERLVPSLATAIGSSADRPAALAELMGILVNDGIRRPVRRIESVKFAAGTPYHTVMAPREEPGLRVMAPEVARAIRSALAEVVERGTARRAAGALAGPGGPLVIGGKTGSGDNRFQVFGPGGVIRASRAVNRTATFAFFVEDRYFGVVTAFVPGGEADHYGFTSSLPTAVFRLLAPALHSRLDPDSRFRLAQAPASVPTSD